LSLGKIWQPEMVPLPPACPPGTYPTVPPSTEVPFPELEPELEPELPLDEPEPPLDEPEPPLDEPEEPELPPEEPPELPLEEPEPELPPEPDPLLEPALVEPFEPPSESVRSPVELLEQPPTKARAMTPANAVASQLPKETIPCLGPMMSLPPDPQDGTRSRFRSRSGSHLGPAGRPFHGAPQHNFSTSVSVPTPRVTDPSIADGNFV
jgi:hypothetical protein